MSDRLPQVKPLERVRALEKLGFVVRRQSGGHAILRHPTTKRMTVVPLHNQEIKRSLLFGILKQCGIGQEQFRRVL